MAQYQYQEQEDLMADFGLPARKEVLKSSTKIGHNRKARRIPSFNSGVLKPTYLRNFLKQTQAHEAAKKSSYISESTSKSNDIKQSTIAGAAESKNVNSCDIWSDDAFDDFSPESFSMLFADAQIIFKSAAEKIPEVAWDDVFNSCSIAYTYTMEAVQQVLKFEEELKFLTSATLLFYGGSWTYLAAVFAGADVFVTQQVLEEAWKIGSVLCAGNLEEDEVLPAQIEQVLRDLGLHFALYTAINVFPAWAEICITIAFASKFASYIPVKEAFKGIMPVPNEDMTEFDENFSAVEDSWFELLALIMSNILSLTLYCFFPRLITAMYMGFIGVSLALECLSHRAREGDIEMFDRLFGLTEMGPFYTWGIIAFFSVWQELSEYKGYCMFLSWLMFLHPVVRVYNMVDADGDLKDDIKVE